MPTKTKLPGFNWAHRDGTHSLYRDGKRVFTVKAFSWSSQAHAYLRVPGRDRLTVNFRAGLNTVQDRAIPEVRKQLVTLRAEIDKVLALLDDGTPTPSEPVKAPPPVPPTRYDLIG